MTTEENIFDEFIGKYQLSKTLRFELRPVGKTADFLKQNKVFEKDKVVDDRYHEIKYYFDILHREFIHQALSGASFSVALYEQYRNAVVRLKAAKNEEKKTTIKDVRDFEAELRTGLAQKFKDTGNAWKKAYAEKEVEFSKDGVDILFEETILEALQKEFQNVPAEYPDAPQVQFINPSTGEKQDLFGAFKGFFTYFSNFNTTKKNLYSAGDEDTAVANRAINENLRKFIENFIQFEEKKEEHAKIGLTSDEREAFDLSFYDTCFIQDGIDAYNRIIGGYTAENGEKIQGINEKINLYNQQHKDKKLRQFGKLFKQIMSKKDKRERVAEIKDDNDVFKTLREFVALNDKKLTGDKEEKGIKALIDAFLTNDGSYDINRVYMKESALNTISSKWFSNWSVIKDVLTAGGRKKKRKSGAEDENQKLPNLVSFEQLRNVLESRSAGKENPIAAEDLFRADYREIYSSAKNHYDAFLKIWTQEWQNCFGEYEKAKREVEEMMSKESYQRSNDEQIARIKTYCDAALAIFQMMKYFALEKGRKTIIPEDGAEESFYNPFNACYQDYPVPAYYNEFRNYLTRKAHLGRLLFPSFDGLAQRHPLSKRTLDGAEKIKLNFENGMLLSGWDRNKEADYYGLIFRDDGRFLLGIMTKNHHDLFKSATAFVAPSLDGFAKMEYRQLNNVFRQLPRIAFAKQNKQRYEITEELEQIRDDFREFQTEKRKDKELKFSQEKLQKLIGLYSKVLHDSLGNDFEFGDVLTRTYDTLNDFFSSVERVTYSLKFIPAKREYIDTLVAGGKIFLFDITNKDLKKQGTSVFKDNLHTLYFRAIFDAFNLADPVIKLSGGAELFFRPRNDQLNKKKDRKGKEIVDHKRYGEDKIFLHLPIVLNIGAGGSFGFNREINSLIAQKENTRKVKIIGVDRGEKHLAYYAIIDQNGNLIDSPNATGHLDGGLPNGSSYLKKLEEKSGRRDEARKEWKTIENIKELKNGYISWVVRKIADMMLNKHAILIFEDLAIGFKRGRQKMEQQVYQKLELALAQKLNYLVQKDAPAGVAGHYLKAYQLTPQVQTPRDIGKQCGAIFYVSPGYTSLTCPQCGYRKNVSFPFENIEKARDLIKKTNLTIAPHDGGFKVAYALSDKERGATGGFEVSSSVERIRWHRIGTDYAKNHRRGESVIEKSRSRAGVAKRYNMTECLKGLFQDFGADDKQVHGADDLIAFDSAEFYRNLFRYLDLLLRSRNSISGTDTDYIQCPGCLFHSDRGFQGQKWNGDANGAYNIARKGLLLLRKIQNAKEPEKISWKDLKIGVGEWDEATTKWAKEKRIGK